jgi:hypothetical protein
LGAAVGTDFTLCRFFMGAGQTSQRHLDPSQAATSLVKDKKVFFYVFASLVLPLSLLGRKA